MSKQIDPEKQKGTLRLFALLDRDGGKFFKAGLLAFVGMIPFLEALILAVTNGQPLALLLCIPAGMIAAPEICGVADTVMRSHRDEVGWWWWDTYKTTWKRNFKATLLPGAVFGLIFGVQIYALYLIALMENPTAEFLFYCGACVVELSILGYYLPMLACMELPFGALLRNCFVLFFNHPIKSVLAGITQVIYYGIILIWFPLTSVILVAASVWLPMLIGTSILYPALDKHFQLKQTYEALQKAQWGGSAVEEKNSEESV